MKYKYLSEKLDSLEKEIHENLRNEIENSTVVSKHISDLKVIKVDIFGYKELGIIFGNLIFLDGRGYHYSLYSDCTLEDLIDILNNIKS